MFGDQNGSYAQVMVASDHDDTTSNYISSKKDPEKVAEIGNLSTIIKPLVACSSNSFGQAG